MPRKARQKHAEAIYHIMCRSASEILLFRDDEDKNYYLDLLKKYTDKFQCSVYAYCAMDTHVHFHIDPKGFDISTFMKCVNCSYTPYYNRKYDRRGSAFAGRFESKIVDSDEYNLTVSAYIHNNPKDIEGYSGKEEEYKYSSYGIYLDIRKDIHNLIDKSFIKGLFNIEDNEKFRERYFAFVSHHRDVGSLKRLKKELSISPENEYISGRKVILRDLSPAKVISFISGKLMHEQKADLATKGKRKLIDFRAFTAYVLRVLCGATYKDICANFHNITMSGCASLCDRGYGLMKDKSSVYSGLFDELLGCKA